LVFAKNHFRWCSAAIVFILAIAIVVLYAGDVEAALSSGVFVPQVSPYTSPPGDTVKPQSKGTLSRRARVLQERAAEQAGQSGVDTSFNELAAIRSLARDSTARMEQFVAYRFDPIAVDPLRPKIHPLYLAEPMFIQTRDVLDSASWTYHVSRKVAGWNSKLPLDYSFDEYSNLRLHRTLRSNWASLAQAYTYAGEKKTGLGELFGKVTNIQIPVPKNPIFSIFGPNIINLHINGGVDVTAGFRNTKNDLIASNPLAQSRNEPEFKQDVQVTVAGEIGDKLKINADWDTKRTFEYENQLKVRYTGYEDEIIQSVEAGNVSLPISSSFISSSQALFGIKAAFQFGPLKLTTVASQKKGQIKELSVSGGARPTPFEKRAPDYSRDHYFLDTAYISLYENVFLSIPAVPDPTLQVRDIEVWVTKTSVTYEQGEREVVAFIDNAQVLANQKNPAARGGTFNSVPGQVEVGKFIRLEQGANADYVLNEYAGIISLNRAVQPDQAVAVAYTLTPDPNNLKFSQDIGNFGSRTTDTLRLVMKLVKPKYLDPSFPVAWKLMLKNRYQLGGRGIKKEGFDLRVEYDVSGQTPLQTVLNNVSLVQMFGLDRYTDQGSPGSDAKFDYLPGITIDENRGELIFPTLEPFSTEAIKELMTKLVGASPAVAATAADSFAFDALYDTTYTGAINSNKNKFAIRGNFTPSIASTYSLGYNIVENSVEVDANGQRAIPNVDYTVDYIAGQVVIKNQAYLTPGTNLQIRYEANDLFQLASKALLGARGEFDVGKGSSLGFTIMNLNQQSLSDKVRLGEEPTSNTILGIDGGTQLDLNFLTRVLNWLPGIQTNAASQFTLRGEAAYMLPDPNTRKSSIQGDNASGMAYVDDFEGAKRPIPLGVVYAGWTDASPPFFSPNLDTYVPGGIDGRTIPTTTDAIRNGQILGDTTKLQYKARASWYNVPYEFFITDIWGKRKSVARGQEQETVLDYYFRPNVRGAYNRSMNLDSLVTGPAADHKKTWSGIQHLLGTTATNLLDENISFIELWIMIDKCQPTTKLNINLGFMSEDVLADGRFHTEDGLKTGFPTGVLHDNEDVGLDGLTDDEERIQFAEFLAKYPQYASDPSGDNYVTPPLSGYSQIDRLANAVMTSGANGTDGNRISLAGHNPDTEDLNRNNNLDRINNYFEYEIPLDTTNADFLKYVAGRGSTVDGSVNRWYQIRIPLDQYVRRIGNPTFTTIEGTRLWVTGAQDEVLFHIAEYNLIGNQWEQLTKNDSSFKVSTVNYEDNPSYVPPDPNLRTKDPTRPDENVLSNEQSLSLVVNGLTDGMTKQAIKRFPIRPLDLFSYKTMKMFVHGDTRIGFVPHYVDTANYDVELFFRFGTDSLNYYEYREPVHPDWDPANEVVIHFEELTAIKLARDSSGLLSRKFPTKTGPPGSTFQVLGQPTLTNVRYVAIGVENPMGKGTTDYSGEVWVDELRLTDVDNAKGWAYRYDTGLKLADVGNVAFSYTDRDPNFHGLEERFGTRTTTRSWTLSASFGFERLLPATWNGTVLSASYSHVEGMTAPKYLPGTDILVSEAVQRTQDAQIAKGINSAEAQKIGDDVRVRSETFSMSESYALPTIKLVIPVDSWMITETINKMTFGYSYNVTRRRDPITLFSESWSWNGRFAYALTFSQNNFLQPFGKSEEGTWTGLKFFYSPKTFSLSATLNRSQSREQARSQDQARPTNRALAATRSMAFSWQFWDGGLLNLGTDYQLDIQSNLTHLEVDQFGQERGFSDILKDIFFTDRIIDFGIDQSYGQTIRINTRLVVPKVWDLDKIFSTSGGYSSRYDWSNNIQAGILGKSAGWNSNLTLHLEVNIKAVSEKIWSTSQASDVQVPGDSAKRSVSIAKRLDAITRALFKNTLFDFERFSFDFTQSNRAQNSGVLGRPGFGNIFARFPFVQSSTIENGPSLLYQLGLSSDPSGNVFIGGKGKFPFISGHSERGLRAPKGNLADIFSQTNNVTMRTSRPLWEGASLDLNWRVNWSYNQNSSLITDSLGVPFERSKVVSGEVGRSFMTFPPVLFFKFFKTGVDEMSKVFEKLRSDPNDTRGNAEKISQAFQDGFEAIPFARKILGDVMPRLNWTIRWDGLEKFSLFKTFAQRVSLEHTYTSDYRRRWKLSPDGIETTESQSMNYGFAPLIGLNVTFKNFMKGNFGGTFRYNVTNSYDMSPSSQNLTESVASDYNITVNFNRQGFEIPFFGLSLTNDIDLSFTYGSHTDSRRIYDFSQLIINSNGNPLEGLGRTTMEPRIRYTLSARVTASLFYRYTKVTPGDGGNRIPGSTVNEGGIEVHVAIQ
jgi:cell surface protein SprA